MANKNVEKAKKSVALTVTELVEPLLGAFVHRRDSWFDSKLASELREIHLNVMLAMFIVVLGLVE